jgi:hypothetical protein
LKSKSAGSVCWESKSCQKSAGIKSAESKSAQIKNLLESRSLLEMSKVC